MIHLLAILSAAPILSMSIMGLWKCFQPGMIFHPLTKIIDFILSIAGALIDLEVNGESSVMQLRKPLYACPACMSSVWGIIFYLIYGHYFLYPTEMALVILMVAFMNFIWCCLLDKITDYGC